MLPLLLFFFLHKFAAAILVSVSVPCDLYLLYQYFLLLYSFNVSAIWFLSGRVQESRESGLDMGEMETSQPEVRHRGGLDGLGEEGDTRILPVRGK